MGCTSLDDCTEDKKYFRQSGSNHYLKMVVIGNFCIYFLFNMLQIFLLLFRTNVDGVFIFRETNENNLKTIYLNYAGVIPKFEIFKAYMTQVTGDYTALYIDNPHKIMGEWYEHVYYWKVPQMDTRDMKFGCHEYIEFGKQRYNEKYNKN